MTLPFVMPSADVFFASPKRVFAHYFYPFPLSIGNAPAPSDYYNVNYLNPAGEAGKHLAYGGWTRARPLAQDPGPANFAQLNMQKEVQMAIARGITGFTFDILSFNDAMSAAGHLQQMFTAAQAVDPRFWVVPMPDMSAMVGITPAQMVQLITLCKTFPSCAKIPDGRLLISAFNATVQPLAWWQSVIAALDAQDVDIAFLPVLLGSPTNSVLDPIAIGTGGWGTATPLVALSPGSFMAPVQPQQFRPKSSIFWEPSCSQTYRNGWTAAILSKITQYVQLITWNDFSEGAMVQPYTDSTLNPQIGSGFYDLTGYYSAWFATGMQPIITKDVLYGIHRRMSSSAAHVRPPTANPALPWQGNFNVVGTPAEERNIELLAFLTAPGTLVINSQSQAAVAGINSMKAPMTPGFPQFKLQRNGSDVFEFKSPVQIYGSGGIPAGLTQGTLDMQYWSFSHSN